MEPVNPKSNSQANNSASAQTENVHDQQDMKADGVDTQPVQGSVQPVSHTPDNAVGDFGLDSDALVNNHAKHNTASQDNRGDDVAQIQDMLLNGEDPTKVLPETAAGTSLKSGGGFDFVTVARTGAEVIASASYQTQSPAYDPVNISFGEKETLPDNVAPSIGDNHGNPVGDVITVITDEDTEVSGKITITDFDNDDVVIRPHTQPAHGNVTISQDGDWTYTPESNYNGKDSFTIEVDDGKGGTDKVIIDVNVASVNDTALVDGDNEGAVTENDNTPILTDHGKLTVNDVDAGESHFKPDVIKGNGTLGDLTIDANGEWHYSVDNSKVNDLPEGITKQEDFTVTTEDGTKHTITVTITGTNDGAAITGDSIGDVKENDNTPVLTDHGKLTVDDADTGESHFKPDVIKGNGTLGDLTIDANGEWHYSVDNSKVNDLPEGITKQEDFTVTTEDGTKHTITVTITGTNDGAAITGDSIGDVKENDNTPVLTDHGKLTVDDADTGESHFKPDVIKGNGTLGDLTIDANGEWHYSVDNSKVNDLPEGITKQEDFTVTTEDGTKHTITVTITGTNDGAAITGDSIGDVKENDNTPVLTDHGKLTVDDADTGESHFKPDVIKGNGTLGDLTIDANGEWHYSVDNSKVNDLPEGITKQEDFTVTTQDGTKHTITVTITGTNDVPTFGKGEGIDTGDVKEDTTLTTSGTLTIDDKDAGEKAFKDQTDIKGQHGTLDIDKAGHWTYHLDNDKADIQALGEGDPLTDTITVTSEDGTTHDITVTITGTNDVPTFGKGEGIDTGDVKEDTTLTTSGTLTIDDKDAGEKAFKDQTDIKGQHGTLDIDKAGHWTYHLDNDKADIQALGEGDPLTDTITVISEDGTTHDITVTITGTNDGAAITGDSIGDVQEDISDKTTAEGSLTVSDADNGQSEVSPKTVTNDYGTFSVDKSGHWTFTINNDSHTVQALGKKDSVKLDFPVSSVDGTDTATVTITVAGTDDGPQITGTDTATLTEDNAAQLTGNDMLSANGALTVSDVDTGESHFKAGTFDGQMGKLTLTNDGHWHYEVSNDSVQHLGANDNPIVETFTVETADGTTHDIVVTIKGTDDKPEVSGTFVGNVVEGNEGDAPVTATGTLTITDADQNDHPAFENGTTAGKFGSLELKDGHWTYTLDESKVQALPADGKTTDSITLTATDGTQQTITIHITGTNDKPVVEKVKTETTENTELNGKVPEAHDVDGTVDHYQLVDNIPEGKGSLTFNADGSYTFNPGKDFDSLPDGKSETVTFTYSATDNNNAVSDPKTVSITVTGSNDAPEVKAVETTTSENTELTSKVPEAHDVDGTVDHYQLVDNIPEGKGSLTFNADGSYTFNPGKDFDSLPDGQSETVTFTYSATDNNNAVSDPKTVTITVTGTDDKPEVSGTFIGSVTEGNEGDAPVTATGTLTITDADHGQNPEFENGTTAGKFGSLELKDGQWTYTLDESKVQALPEGHPETDSMTLTATDGTQQTITIHITGTDDKPEISGTFIGNVTEGNEGDTPVTATGTLTITDADHGQNPEFGNVTTAGKFGSLELKDGHWTYTLDESKVQALPEGHPETDSITLTATDGTQQTITINITGTNDGAAITGDNIGEVKENDNTPVLTDHGKLTVNDTDTGESHFKPDVIKGNGTLGDLTIDANGEWHYSVDNSKVNDLPEGITKQEDFTVTTEDGTKHTITVTITGTNDGAAISGDSIGDVQEDISDKTTAEGSLTVSDADNGQSEVTPKTVTNDYGTFSVDKSGHWTFTINNDNDTVQALGKNDSVKLDFPVSSVDGTDTATVTITVAGTDDGPQITGTDTATLTEDNAAQLTGNDMLSANGALTVSDVDTGESHFKAGTFDGQMGKLTLTNDGHWHYEVSNDSVQHLGANDNPIVETFTVETADGTTHDIVVTIKGTDDKPEVSGTFVGNVVEGNEGDAPVTATGTLTISDEDQNDHPAFENDTTAGKFGSLELKDGQWTYTLDESKVQALPKGHPETDSITLTATDGTQQTITIHITGTNDKPIVDAEITGGIFEGNPAQTVTLTDNITDIDGDTLTVVDGSIKGLTDGVTVKGNTLTVDPSNSAFDGLKEGETKEITVTYQVTDGHGATVDQTATITVTGTNDVPVVGEVITKGVIEGETSQTVTLTDNITDVDGDTLTVVDGSIKGLTDGVTVKGNTLTVDPSNSAFDGLKEGETKEITVTYQVTDGHGATVDQTATITVTGTNDAPKVGSVITEGFTEGNPAQTVTLTDNITDIDGDTLTVVDGSIKGLTDGVTVDGNKLTIDPSNSAFDGLKEGETKEIKVTYQVTDGHGATVDQTATITVTGTNDAPKVGSVITEGVVEGETAQTVTLTDNITDVDGDTLTVVDGSIKGLTDGVTVKGNTLTVDPSNQAFDGLKEGETKEIKVTYQVTDGHGETVDQTATITVTGTNDAPKVGSVITEGFTEGNPAHTVTLTDNITDVDGDSLTVIDGSIKGLTDGVTIDGNKLTIDPSSPAFDGLKEGETKEIKVTYQVTDGHGATVDQTATITVTGTNDAPKVSSAITEGYTEGTPAQTIDLTTNITDVDGDTLTVVDGSIKGLTDGVTVKGNTLTVDPSNSAFDGLKEGETKEITVTYQVTDGHGETVDQTATITVTGTNDAPKVGSIITEGVVEGETTQTVTLTDNITDIDGDTLTVVDGSIKGLTDGVTVKGNKLTIDPSNQAFDGLKEGETKEIKVTYQVTDGHRATVDQTATITVTGTNDAPKVGSVITESVVEGETAQTVTLTDNITDIDGDTLTVVDGSIKGLTDGVTVKGNTLTVDPSNQAFDGLKEGETKEIKVTYQVTDGHGETVDQTATITVTGTNDAPKVGSVITEGFTEGNPAHTVTLTDNITDVDGDSLTVIDGSIKGLTDGVTIDGNKLTIDPSSPAFDGLKEGETKEIKVTYQVTDGHGATVDQTATITVTGTNDAPKVSSAITEGYTEGTPAQTIDLTTNITDIDGDTLTVVDGSIKDLPPGVTVDGNTLTIDPANPAFNGLAEGDKQTITVTYQVTDGHGATVDQTATITVTGTNDVPVVGEVITKGVNEGGAAQTVTLTDNITDVDGDTLTVVDGSIKDLPPGVTVDGNTLTVDPSNSAFDGLAEGDQQTITVTYDVTDGHTTVQQTATITVTGTNDVPVVGEVITKGVNEGGAAQTVTLTDNITDVDSDTLTVVDGSIKDLPPGVTVDGNTLTVDPANPAFNGLAEGDQQTITVTYDVTDGHTTVQQTATITVTGTNDMPVVGDIITKGVNEGGAAQTVTLTDNITDIDGDTLTVVDGSIKDLPPGVTVDGNTLTVDPSNSAFDGLAEGDQQTITVTYDVTDGHTTVQQTATITVTGTNDAPKVSSAITEGYTEGTPAQTIDLTTNITDVDGDSLTVVDGSIKGLTDGVTVDGNKLTIDPSNPAFDGLKEGETKEIKVTYQVTDGHGATVDQTATITVTGTNDRAHITGETIGSVTENDATTVLTDHGKLDITDLDNGEAHFKPDVIEAEGTLGNLSIDANGEWHYSVENSLVNYLGAGESKVESFTVTSEDGTTQTVTVTIHGTDDKPVVSGSFTSKVTEGNEGDAPVTVSGTIAIADADQHDHPVFDNGQFKGLYGSLELKGGHWTYTLDEAKVQQLPEGEEVTDTVTLTASDGTQQEISVVISGTNDNAIIGGADHVTAYEDLTTRVRGILSSYDVDNAQDTFKIETLNGKYGSLSMSADGLWTYKLNNSSDAVQQLQKGEIKTETFTVHSEDGTAHQITVDVKGENDSADITGNFTGKVIEDQGQGDKLTSHGTLAVKDIDHDESYFNTTVTKPADTLGNLTIDRNGNWTYDVDNSKVQYLGAGDTKDETFTVTSADGTEQKITVTITGTNDAAHIDGTVVGTVTEDGDSDYLHNDPELPDTSTSESVEGKLTVDDIDGQDAFKASQIDGKYGHFEIDTDGSWKYVLDNKSDAVQQLSGKETQTETFTVHTADGSSKDIVITVNGHNDHPEIGYVDAPDQHRVDKFYYEGDGDVRVFNDITLKDVDSSEFSHVTVRITAGINGNVQNNYDAEHDFISLSPEMAGKYEITQHNYADHDGAVVGSWEITAKDGHQLTHDEVLEVIRNVEYRNTMTDQNGVSKAIDVFVQDDQGAPSYVVISDMHLQNALSDHASGSEDMTVTGNVLSNDASDKATDINVESFTLHGQEYTAGNHPVTVQEGTLILETNGHYSFAPAPNWSGKVPDITYTTNHGGTAKLEISVTPEVDAPTLQIGNTDTQTIFTFDNVNLGNHELDANVDAGSLIGNGQVIKWQSTNPGQDIEIGREDVYLKNGSDNQALEVEANPGDKNIYTDLDLTAGKHYQMGFDITARVINPGSCNLTITLTPIDEHGNATGQSETLYRFTPSQAGWVRDNVIDLPVETSGKYRLEINGDNGDTVGAVLDNVTFTAQSGVGYEDNFINLNPIEASLTDTDGSETLKVELSGLPDDAVIVDGNSAHTTVHVVNGVADVSGLDLGNLSVKTSQVGDYNVRVTATATETGTGATSSQVADMTVSVKEVPVHPENIINGNGGNDQFVLIGNSYGAQLDVSLSPYLQADGTWADIGAGAGQQIKKLVDTTIDTDLVINSGDSNDYVDLGLSRADNTVNAGSSLPSNHGMYNVAMLEGTHFMQDSMQQLTGDDGHLKPDYQSDLQSGHTSNRELPGNSEFGHSHQGNHHGQHAIEFHTNNHQHPLADLVNMGSGNDTVTGGTGTLAAYGGAGNDTLSGGSGSDALRGGSGNDVLLGGTGDDILRGDTGNDVIQGGTGSDILIGDGGADTFRWTAEDIDHQHSVDVIKDFELSKDKLDLSGLIHENSNGIFDNVTVEVSKGSRGNLQDVSIQIDTDGDHRANQEIVLEDINKHELTSIVGSSHGNGVVQNTTLNTDQVKALFDHVDTQSVHTESHILLQDPEDLHHL
ncbi:VCBS domain-containing protein [Parasalinivibrio latis]|uniref:VCBS domain-containing protein n=1 Tax=Parasalinivibrio latis TaxID=2952610 RepID=UPI0030DE5396